MILFALFFFCSLSAMESDPTFGQATDEPEHKTSLGTEPEKYMDPELQILMSKPGKTYYFSVDGKFVQLQHLDDDHSWHWAKEGKVLQIQTKIFLGRSSREVLKLSEIGQENYFFISQENNTFNFMYNGQEINQIKL